ncbi:MAG: DUF3592 domain-containing protein [Ruminococcus sp.]|nr:DUF3592 domain-containing protein [Ruminococcus sp.]
MKEGSIFSEFYELIKKIKIYHIVAVFIISALLFSLSFFNYRSSVTKIEKCTAKVYGTVSDVNVRTEHKWKYRDGKKVRYTETITTAYISVETDGVFNQSSISKRTKAFNKGDKVTIHYDPDKPGTYYLNDDAVEDDFIPIMGIFFFAVGFALTLLYRVNKKAQEGYY